MNLKELFTPTSKHSATRGPSQSISEQLKTEPVRQNSLDIKIAAGLVVAVLVAWLVAWFSGSAASSKLRAAAVDIPAYKTSSAIPRAFKEEWAEEDEFTGAPLVSRGSAITKNGDTLNARNAGMGTVNWSYSRPEALCAAAVYSERLAAVYDGPGGCGQVTGINPQKGTYENTRWSVVDDSLTTWSTWNYMLVYGPSRVEIWRSDLVRTLEYGRVDAPSEKVAQPRKGCDIKSAGLNEKQAVVVERCPEENQDRFTFMKINPKDSRKPQNVRSENVDADEIHVFGMTTGSGPTLAEIRQDDKTSNKEEEKSEEEKKSNDDSQDKAGSALALVKRGEKWTVERFDGPTNSTVLTKLDGAPKFMPTPDYVTADSWSVRWFDGSVVRAYSVTDGDEMWTNDKALGPGTLLGRGVGGPDQNTQFPSTYLPTATGIEIVDSKLGTSKRQFQVNREGTFEFIGMAQIGDIVVERRGNKLHGMKAISGSGKNFAPSKPER